MKQRLGHRRDAAQEPAAAHPRRADERPRPGRHPRDPRHDPQPGRAAASPCISSSHILAEVQQVCDHVSIIGRGRLLASGSVDEVVGDSVPRRAGRAWPTSTPALPCSRRAGFTRPPRRRRTCSSRAPPTRPRITQTARRGRATTSTELTPVRADLETVFLELTGRASSAHGAPRGVTMRLLRRRADAASSAARAIVAAGARRARRRRRSPSSLLVNHAAAVEPPTARAPSSRRDEPSDNGRPVHRSAAASAASSDPATSAAASATDSCIKPTTCSTEPSSTSCEHKRLDRCSMAGLLRRRSPSSSAPPSSAPTIASGSVGTQLLFQPRRWQGLGRPRPERSPSARRGRSRRPDRRATASSGGFAACLGPACGTPRRSRDDRAGGRAQRVPASRHARRVVGFALALIARHTGRCARPCSPSTASPARRVAPAGAGPGSERWLLSNHLVAFIARRLFSRQIYEPLRRDADFMRRCASSRRCTVHRASYAAALPRHRPARAVGVIALCFPASRRLRAGLRTSSLTGVSHA